MRATLVTSWSNQKKSPEGPEALGAYTLVAGSGIGLRLDRTFVLPGTCS